MTFRDIDTSDYECEHYSIHSRINGDGLRESYCFDCGRIFDDEYEDGITEDEDDDEIVPANETLGDPEE